MKFSLEFYDKDPAAARVCEIPLQGLFALKGHETRTYVETQLKQKAIEVSGARHVAICVGGSKVAELESIVPSIDTPKDTEDCVAYAQFGGASELYTLQAKIVFAGSGDSRKGRITFVRLYLPTNTAFLGRLYDVVFREASGQKLGDPDYSKVFAGVKSAECMTDADIAILV